MVVVAGLGGGGRGTPEIILVVVLMAISEATTMCLFLLDLSCHR